MLLIQKISEPKLVLFYLYYYTRYNYNNAITQNKKIENISPPKEIEDKSEENSENSESDFFQGNKRKKSENIENKSNKSHNSENNDQNNYQGILNVHQRHELTSNKLYAFKKYKMSKEELKDLIFYLENNQTIPLIINNIIRFWLKIKT